MLGFVYNNTYTGHKLATCTYEFLLSGSKYICCTPKNTWHNNQLVDGGQY